MTDDRPPDDHWLTYVEASDFLGVSPEAVRALARRQKWPRQRPNAIGQPVRVLIPADRARPPVTNGHDHHDQRSTTVTANGHDQGDHRSTGHDDNVREAIKSLGEAVSSLGVQLLRERERADRAEGR